MKIFEVQTERDRKDFLSMPVKIYKDDPNWIRPLDNDIESIFDNRMNKFYRHGKCSRFLLKDEQGNVNGRIAAFINDRTSKKEAQPTGGIGFFECINDKQSAHFLFDHCRQWLLERGMEAMDGPINFGERDSWWGLITEGFTGVYETPELGETRSATYDYLSYPKPPMLVRQRETIQIHERVDFRGNILTPMDEAEVRSRLAKLKGTGVESVGRDEWRCPRSSVGRAYA